MAKTAKFIVFEGIDGSGTTTQLSMLEKWLQTKDNPWGSVFFTKEPTTGPVGLFLRQILSKKIELSDENAMALLFAADRAHHQQELQFNLDRGIHVFSDRYILSSLAYQSLAMKQEWIEEINNKAMSPDLTLLFLVSPEESTRRRQASRSTEELYEQTEFLRKVQDRYQELAESMTAQNKPIKIIDASKEQETVFKDVIDILSVFFG